MEEQEDTETCGGHSGYVKRRRAGDEEGVWSCCGEDAGPSTTPCVTQEHIFAEWPDEEAKKYFYDKPKRPDYTIPLRDEFAQFGRFNGLFRQVKQYKIVGEVTVVKIPVDQQKKLDALERKCLNWGCSDTYKEENNHKKACWAHTGRWDFGHTGSKLSQPQSGDELMWPPHWTCCTQGWDEDRCTKMRHRGPYLSEFEENPSRKYEHPDPRAMMYFKKKISHHWKQKMSAECNYDEDQLKSKLHYLAQYNNGNVSKKFGLTGSCLWRIWRRFVIS